MKHGEEASKKHSLKPHSFHETTTLSTVKGVLKEAFTRRHYKQIAELIKGHTDDKTRQRLANEHAKAFAKDNPRFSHEKFHAAAGTQYSHISNQDN
jgi:hypothetical protein